MSMVTGSARSVADATIMLPSRQASALSNRVKTSRLSCASSELISACWSSFVAMVGCSHTPVYGPGMEVTELAHLRRARDLLDREYARPLDVSVMARAALMSPSLFPRRLREAYGDTPY